jgi:hypothetical protein
LIESIHLKLLLMKKITTNFLCIVAFFASILSVSAQNVVTTTGSTSSSICDGSATADQSQIGPNWSWLSGTTILQTGGITITALCPGDYSLKYFDAYGNEVFVPFTIYLNSDPCSTTNMQAGLVPTASTTAGACDGTITVNAGGGVAPYTYSLNGASSQSMNVFSNLCPANYIVVVYDYNNCAQSFTVFVQDASNPCASSNLQIGLVPAPSNNPANCNGTITVNAAGGVPPYTYSMNGGPSQSTNMFVTLCPATYAVNVTDGNGCSMTDTVIIENDTTNSNPCSSLYASYNFINASTPNNCDGSLTVFGNGGTPPYLYSSDMGNSYLAVNSFSGLCVGTHIIKVQDANGCIFDAFGMVGVDSTNTPCANSPLSVVLNGTPTSNATSCDGTLSATVTGFGSGYVFQWSNNLGSSSLDLINLCPGDYHITVTTDDGCTISVHKPVGVNSTNSGCAGSTLMSVITGANSTNIGSCNGSLVVNAGGGVAPYSYSIDNGATIVPTPNFDNLCPGMYHVFLGDAAGCVINYSHHVGIDSTSSSNPCANSSLSISIAALSSSSASACDGALHASVSGGILPIIPHWSNGVNSLGNDNLCPGTYTLHVVDGNGCTMVATGFVGGYYDSTTTTQMPLNGYVIPSGVSGDGFCDGNASVVAYGGVQPYTYAFSNANTTTNNAVGLCAGYQSVIVTDNNGASMTLDFIIGSPQSTTTTNNFVDSTIVDSVYNDAISDCDIDFSLIDSVYIAGYSYLASGSISVTWAIVVGDSTIALVDTYFLTNGAPSVAAGVYMLVLQIYCPNKAVDQFLSATDQMYYNEAHAGMQEKTQNSFHLFPNPFGNNVTIQLDNSQKSEVTVTDVTGKVVFNNSFNASTIKLDLSHLASGQYIVTVNNASSVMNRKIIK